MGSEWPKWGQNCPSALDTYLIYLFDSQAVRNGYSIIEARSNTYVALQTNIERDKQTSLSKPIKLPLSQQRLFYRIKVIKPIEILILSAMVIGCLAVDRLLQRD